MVPVFKIVEKSEFYNSLPEDNQYFRKKTFARYLIVYANACAAYFIPNLSMFLNLIGGVNGVYIIFVLPALLYIKVFEKEISKCYKVFLYLLLAIGTLGGLVAVVASIHVMIFTDNNAGGGE